MRSEQKKGRQTGRQAGRRTRLNVVEGRAPIYPDVIILDLRLCLDEAREEQQVDEQDRRYRIEGGDRRKSAGDGSYQPVVGKGQSKAHDDKIIVSRPSVRQVELCQEVDDRRKAKGAEERQRQLHQDAGDAVSQGAIVFTCETDGSASIRTCGAPALELTCTLKIDNLSIIEQRPQRRERFKPDRDGYEKYKSLEHKRVSDKFLL